MSSCFVASLPKERHEALRALLQSQGFTLSQPPHTLFQGKKEGVICTLYASGKLTVQGKGMKEFIQFYLEPEILGTFQYGYEKLSFDPEGRIGVDESGKGDFFGPLCIAGVFAEKEGIAKLLEWGVKDSKRLTDSSISKIATKIRAELPYHVIRLNPLKYNELYTSFGNLNLLLAWGHAAVIETLAEKTGCTRALIDQFAAEPLVERNLTRKKLAITVTQRTQGEQDPVVAAASILARAAFVEGLEMLGKEVEETLPKGASSLTISVGKKLVEKWGEAILQKICKMHFKTRRDIL